MEAATQPQEEASHRNAQGGVSNDESPQETGLHFAECPCQEKETGVGGWRFCHLSKVKQYSSEPMSSEPMPFMLQRYHLPLAHARDYFPPAYACSGFHFPFYIQAREKIGHCIAFWSRGTLSRSWNSWRDAVAMWEDRKQKMAIATTR